MLYDFLNIGLQTVINPPLFKKGDGYEPLLMWQIKWLPWCSSSINDRVIDYLPPSLEQGTKGEIIATSASTLMHEFCHIIGAGHDRILIRSYDLESMNKISWIPELPPNGPWASYCLKKQDQNKAIEEELKVSYLVMDILYKAGNLVGIDQIDIQEIFYDEREVFYPEAWHYLLETIEGFESAPTFVRSLAINMFEDQEDQEDQEEMLTDLVKALGETLLIRKEARRKEARRKEARRKEARKKEIIKILY